MLLHERMLIPYSRQWTELADYLKQKQIQMTTDELKRFLNGLAAILKKEKITKQEYLLWSRKLEQLRKEVEA